MKATFGEDLVLVHSSGVPLPTDEFGFLMHTLQHGEAYFLVIIQSHTIYYYLLYCLVLSKCTFFWFRVSFSFSLDPHFGVENRK